MDLKPGSIAPDGRIVAHSEMYYGDPRMIAVHVTFEDGTMTALSWPNGSGWTVNGRTAP